MIAKDSAVTTAAPAAKRGGGRVQVQGGGSIRVGRACSPCVPRRPGAHPPPEGQITNGAALCAAAHTGGTVPVYAWGRWAVEGKEPP